MYETSKLYCLNEGYMTLVKKTTVYLFTEFLCNAGVTNLNFLHACLIYYKHTMKIMYVKYYYNYF